MSGPTDKPGERRRRLSLTAAWIAALLACVAPSAAAGEAKDLRARITRTAHGIPNIEAKSWRGLGYGYGYGYAFAQDNLCEMAETYVTVRAQRSRYFGPQGEYLSRGNGATINNLDSDFFFQRIIDKEIVEKLIRRRPPIGPRTGLAEVVRGYVAGYNSYLEDTGVQNIPDPRCRGEEWVKPIRLIDAFRRFYQLGLLASQGVAVDGIADTGPPGGDLSGRASPTSASTVTDSERGMIIELDERLSSRVAGSNAYGLGAKATRNGRGMVLANPHFPWDGPERFYQAHATIPGKVNVSGASLFGVPAVLIGHTNGLAWSHTVSTAFRFTPFELRLMPGSPTTYMVDGKPHQMTRDRVTVQARTADGGLERRTRTLWGTRYGPVFDSILGLPLFPWTATTAYAMGDVNAENLRYLNHFFATNQAQSVGELYRILKRYQGIPWVNTIAADEKGRALYADIGAIPAVPDGKVDECNVPLGRVTNELIGLPVLDGSRSACEWDHDPDAVVPGTFGPRNEPHLFRRDYVTNSNDSYWLSNPKQPLEGFARIIGDERTARSLRTRLGLIMAQERIAGDDSYRGERFTRSQLQRVVFNNRQYAGELWREELVELCEQSPVLVGTSGPVDVSDACPVLEKWDVRDNLRSKGSILFRRFAARVLASPIGVGGPLVSPFDSPFDVDDPVHTPSGLNTASPAVRQAFADAVHDLRAAGIPLGARLGRYQYEVRDGQRIPIHGGPGEVGVFNAIYADWNGSGFDDVELGSSFVMVTSFTDGCPDDRSILTYSQSTNPRSPWFGDQTSLFSRKRWVNPPFCPAEVRRADPVSVTRLGPNGTR